MLPIYVAKQATPAEFVAFWAPYYSYKKEHLYTNNIGQPFTAERIHELYEWKNGSRLAAPKRRSVEQNYISRISDIANLAPSTSAEEFLRKFPSGGAIWRIFWLHCWRPECFPIMTSMCIERWSTLSNNASKRSLTTDANKEQSYIERYLPFHMRFKSINAHSVDRALWFYGKFVKAIKFPLP